MFHFERVNPSVLIALCLILALPACVPGPPATVVPQLISEPVLVPDTIVYELPLIPQQTPQIPPANPALSLALDIGGDHDVEDVGVVLVDDNLAPTDRYPSQRTGDGAALPSADGNTVADYYMQFIIPDSFLFEGSPTSCVKIEVEYLDKGTDTFMLQYDAQAGGPYGDGRFKDTNAVGKTATGEFKTAEFPLCDAYFGNRLHNVADFRIDDASDGAETIRRVAVTRLADTAGPQIISVDSCGADPFDSQPDSDAIQACIDQAGSGDTVTFTSFGGSGYQGYLIDKTIFLVANTAKTGLTFTATDPGNRALLQATDDLKGFVVSVVSRSQVPNYGEVDDITISHLHLDGNRDNRVCQGQDNIGNGVDDNWGTWLPNECPDPGDGLCNPGTLNMCAGSDLGDVDQDYLGNPSAWSTGFLVDDILISNTECATALTMCAAVSTIRDTTIDTAGDHVHGAGCALSDNDEPSGAWADGITFEGPGHTITGNTILDASDVGIVFFGGRDTVISNNTIQARQGNYGMFAAIAIHPWGWGDVSGTEITGNVIANKASTTCGGIHAGINIGTHMWGGGCVGHADLVAVGNPNACTTEPPQPGGTQCVQGAPCQIWAHVAAGETFTLTDNHVSGAHINYLIEGLDLVGSLVESGNTSDPPRMTDWQAAVAGCWNGVSNVTWGPEDRVAHHPAVSGWTNLPIHCER